MSSQAQQPFVNAAEVANAASASTAGPTTPRIIAQDILGNPVLTSEIIKEVAIWLIAYIDDLRANGCINRSDLVIIRDIPKLLVTRAKLISAGPRFRAPVLDANNTFAMAQAAKDVGNFLYQGIEVQFLPDVRYQRMALDVLFDLADHALAEDGASTGTAQEHAPMPLPTLSMSDVGDPTIPTAMPVRQQGASASNDSGYFDRAPKPLHPRASALQRPPLTPQLSNFGAASSRTPFSGQGSSTSAVAPRPSFVSRYSKAKLFSVNNQALDSELEAQVSALQQRIAALQGPNTTVTTTVTTAAPVPSGSDSAQLPDLSSLLPGDTTISSDAITGNVIDGQGVSTIDLSALASAGADILPGMPIIHEDWILAPENRNETDAEGSHGRVDVGI